MILIVTLNPALDVTYHAGRVDWDGVNRPHRVTGQPGGKGINVARTLRALGTENLAAGLGRGATGEALPRGLREDGIACELAGIAGQARRTLAVVDAARGTTALFNEPGPAVDRAEWDGFCVLYEKSLGQCAAVVLTGSLPPGVPEDGYAVLAARAAAAGVPVLLDAGGAALRAGVAAGPAIAKPNLAELASAQDGGNPTGAGDAVAAALAQGLACGWGWPERLRQAAALGAATAAAPVAGVFGQDAYRAALAGVRVEQIGRDAAGSTPGAGRPGGPGEVP